MPSIRTFTGEFPILDATMLPDTAAQLSRDCDFGSGNLRGIPAPVPVANLPFAPKALAPYVSNSGAVRMFSFPYDVDAVRSPVANDAYQRFYWTDGTRMYVSRGDGIEGNPKQNNNFNRVGVPAPTSAPARTSSTAVFTIPGVPNINFFRACETSTGALTGKTAVAASVISQSTHRLTMTLNMAGLACIATVTPTTVVSCGIVQVGLVPYEYETPAGWSAEVRPEYATVYRAIDGGRYYCFVPNEMALYKGLPNGLADYGPVSWNSPETGGIVSMYYLSGTQNAKGAWFCSQHGAAAPTFDLTNAGVSTLSSSPVIPIVADLAGGGTATGVLRPGGNSTLPPELAGYDITVVIEGTTATLTWAYAGSDMQSRDYVVTCVNVYGEESAPSPPLTLDALDGETISLLASPPSIGEYLAVTKYRWYRTATGASGDTQYLFVLETSAPSVTDNVRTELLGEPIPTIGYLPPEDGLRGLISLPNGVLAAFKNNEIHFSEPYLPYAWKRENIMTTALPIIDMCAADGGFYVTTKGEPYFISGVTPDSMAQMKITAPQAGVGRMSIVRVGSAVVYASNDGLVLLQGGQASMDMSFKFFDRAVWRRRYGSKLQHMRLNAHDGMLVVWFVDGTPGFMLTLDEGAPAFTRLKDPIYAAAIHPQRDALWVAVNTTAYEFAAGSSSLPFDWWSKEFIFPKPANLGVLQILGGGPMAVRVYADGAQVFSQAITVSTLSGTVRLPSGFLATTWSVRVEGGVDSYVNQVHLVGSSEELKRV